MASPLAKTMRRRIRRILDNALPQLDASSVGVYFLDTRTNRFALAGGSTDFDSLGHQIDTDLVSTAVANTHGASTTAFDPESGLIVVRHKRTPAVLLCCSEYATDPRAAEPEYFAIAEIMRQMFFQLTVARVLEPMKEPVDFKTDRATFLDRLGQVILASSNVQFAALRELKDGSRLECLDSWGFRTAHDAEELSFEVDAYEPFQLAYLGETVVEPDIHREGLEDLASLPGLEDVVSFLATPVLVGDQAFGVLSVATSFHYDFPQLHQLGIEALSNAVGVSVNNYRNFHGGGLTLDELADTTMMATGVEVAQAARHEATTHVDTAIHAVANIEAGIPSRHRESVRDDIVELTDALLSTEVAIDKIRLATKPPTLDDRSLVSLREVWDEVIDQLGGRLDLLGIEHRVNGEASKAKVMVLRGWFRQVFLHLVLNSADAFAGKGRGTRKPPRNNRQISLTVERSGPKASTVVARYSDNATGISLHELSGPDRYLALPLEQRIFAPNITSKPNGGGWGMFLVRRILDEHGGSIDLEDSRGGVSFRITLPKPQ